MKNLLLPIFILSITHASAAIVAFSFHDGSNTIGTGSSLESSGSSGTSLVSGVTLSADALLDGVTTGTVFNGATGSFGINATGTGDDTQRFDNGLGVESMVFSFDVAGTFTSIDLRFIEEAANEAVLSFAGGNSYELNTTTALSGADDFNIGESFTAGQLITLQISSSPDALVGENFSLESFTINTVPEPSSTALLGLGGLALILRRRK